MTQTKSKQERQAWWRGLTLEEQADYVEKVMRRQGKTPDRELVVKNLVEQGQYKGANAFDALTRLTEGQLNAIRNEIDVSVRQIDRLADNIFTALGRMRTADVDALGLYEYEPSTQESIRFKFFNSTRTMLALERYFHDEEWAQWELYRDEEMGRK